MRTETNVNTTLRSPAQPARSARRRGNRNDRDRGTIPSVSGATVAGSLLAALLAKRDQSFGRDDVQRLAEVPNRYYGRSVLDFVRVMSGTPRSHKPHLDMGFVRARVEAFESRQFQPVRQYLQEQLCRACSDLVESRDRLHSLPDLGSARLHGIALDDFIENFLDSLRPDVDIRDRLETTRTLKALHEAVQFHDVFSLATLAGLSRTELESLAKRLEVTLDAESFPSSWAPQGKPSPTAGTAEGNSESASKMSAKATILHQPEELTFRIEPDGDERWVRACVHFETAGRLEDLFDEPDFDRRARWCGILAAKLLDTADELRKKSDRRRQR